MLILTRGNGEAVTIGDTITVTVVAVAIVDGRYQVRLGIDAPRDVGIHRTPR